MAKPKNCMSKILDWQYLYFRFQTPNKEIAHMDPEFCFPFTKCPSKFTSLREMRKHLCDLQDEHESMEDNKLEQIKCDNRKLNMSFIFTSKITTENTKLSKIVRSNLNEYARHTPNKNHANF